MKDLVYTYKGNSYMIIESNAKMKHPETGEWDIAVIYRNPAGQVFVRERIDFYAKFQLK